MDLYECVNANTRMYTVCVKYIKLLTNKYFVNARLRDKISKHSFSVLSHVRLTTLVAYRFW